MSFQDINFAKEMYTKISDIKVNNTNTNFNVPADLDFINYRDNDYYTENKDYYKENKDDTEEKIQIKKNKKIKEKNTKEILIRKYILIFILFYILNSYYFINLLNTNNLNYNYSLILRGFLLIILYHFLKSFC
jgi:hypothetical protein